jgi:hypothetical protein
MRVVAGVPISDELTLELADLLRGAGDKTVARMLETAMEQDRTVVPLTIEERDSVLATLDHPPDGLLELRRVLLMQCDRRVREGSSGAGSRGSTPWR